MVPAHGEGLMDFSFLFFSLFLFECPYFGYSKFSVSVMVMMTLYGIPTAHEKFCKIS